MSRPLHNSICAALLAALLLSASSARAESFQTDGPVGRHEASGDNASGAGSADISANGHYGAVIPISLMPARGGMQVPFSIAHVGGSSVGEAGVGWAISIPRVERSATREGRRPILQTGPVPASSVVPVPRIFMDLGTGPSLMNFTGTASTYRALSSTSYGDLVGPLPYGSDAQGAWSYRDPSGRTWEFIRFAPSDSIWYLRAIRGQLPDDVVTFDYTVGTPETGAREILLSRIAYSYVPMLGHPSPGCPKHFVELAYAPPSWVPAGTILTRTVADGAIYARTQLLESVSMRVNQDSCATGDQRTASVWDLEYAPDADTGQPRLVTVDRYGTDPTVKVPVARYGYGSAFTKGVLELESAGSFPLPSADAAFGRTETIDIGSNTFLSDHRLSLSDFTGDGRPDLLRVDGSGTRLRRNQHDLTFAAEADLFSDPAIATPLVSRQVSKKFSHPGTGTETFLSMTMVDFIDWNGDGRLDVVEAGAGKDPATGAASVDFWRVLLNLHEPGGTQKWVERFVDIRPLRQKFSALGYADIDFSQPLPIRRSQSAGRVEINGCWEDVVFDLDTSGAFRCSDGKLCVSGDWECWGKREPGPGQVVTEWKLEDVNGDSLPDVVFNGSTFDDVVSDGCIADPCYLVEKPHLTCYDDFGTVTCACEGFKTCESHWQFDLPSGNQILAFYNHNGAGLADPTTSSEWTETPFVLTISQCGVERYEETPSADRRDLKCGFADVNGDGLIDRVEGTEARLNTGLSFSTAATIALPGLMSSFHTEEEDVCGTSSTSTPYYVRQTHGLVDLTGDGLVDYVVKSGTVWNVHPGTGNGFAAPRPIDSAVDAFELSVELNRCDGLESRTVAGIVDVDGDGRADLLTAGTGASGGALVRIERANSAAGLGIPDSGQLNEVANGYGARTIIEYRSAKTDGVTAHQVPFPEMVVHKVTRISSVVGVGINPVQYAFGDAFMRYDSLQGRFVPTGYRRRITVHAITGTNNAVAHVEDFNGYQDVLPGLSRHTLLGRLRAKTTLVGVANDPWALLAVDVLTDARRRGADKYGSMYLDTTPGVVTAMPECREVDPYGFTTTGWPELCNDAVIAYDANATHWEGANYPSGDQFVESEVRVKHIDPYGRVIVLHRLNDVWRSDDDFCVETDYAKPVSSGSLGVLDAVAAERITDCGGAQLPKKVLAATRYTYDGLPEGDVAEGLLTSVIVERRDPVSGALLETFTDRVISYGSLGNVDKVVRKDAGGKGTITTFVSDLFGVLVRSTDHAATDVVPHQSSSVSYHEAFLLPTVTADTEGVLRRTTYDTLGRPTRVTVEDPKVGIEYVLSEWDYLGDSGMDPLGRRVVSRTYKEWTISPPPPGAPGVQETTTFFDDFGRVRYAQSPLGSDYGGRSLISGRTDYDPQGRVKFVADTYVDTEDPLKVYGTSYTYQTDGRIRCRTRAAGYTALTTTDAAADRYPQCFTYLFAQYTAVIQIRGSNELASGTPQSGAYDDVRQSAIGWELSRARYNALGRVEHSLFSYDRLGQRIKSERSLNPAINGAPTVPWTFTLDSLGRTLSVSEPAAATLHFVNDQFGNVVETYWMDTSVTPAVKRRVISEFDGFGRETRKAQYRDLVLDPSVPEVRFGYDVPSTDPAHAGATFLSGRLAWAFDGELRHLYWYDALGRTTQTVYQDVPGAKLYKEKLALRADGDLAALTLRLPSTPFDETASYHLDSAGRVRTVDWTDPSGTVTVFAGTVDDFGRYLLVDYGNGAQETFAYRLDRRRELQSRKLTSTGTTRNQSFLKYDGDGRLMSTQLADTPCVGCATTVEATTHSYDVRNRLAQTRTLVAGSPVLDESFAYDAIGNMTQLTDAVGAASIVFTRSSTDPDRLCRTDAPGAPIIRGCEWFYDLRGNVTSGPDAAGALRTFEYDADSKALKVLKGTAQAKLRYGAFDELTRLEITGAGTSNRTDLYFGPHMQRSTTPSGTYEERRIPGPLGLLMVRRGAGPAATVLYVQAENRGTRATTDGAGAEAQYVKYRPYGGVLSNTGIEGSSKYVNELWNGGEELRPFGVSRLGHRLYDDAHGRFVQRDPLLMPRGASRQHPYAFAFNDPVNYSDPSGLDANGYVPPPPDVWDGGGGGGRPQDPWGDEYCGRLCFGMRLKGASASPAPEVTYRWNEFKRNQAWKGRFLQFSSDAFDYYHGVDVDWSRYSAHEIATYNTFLEYVPEALDWYVNGAPTEIDVAGIRERMDQMRREQQAPVYTPDGRIVKKGFLPTYQARKTFEAGMAVSGKGTSVVGHIAGLLRHAIGVALGENPHDWSDEFQWAGVGNTAGNFIGTTRAPHTAGGGAPAAQSRSKLFDQVKLQQVYDATVRPAPKVHPFDAVYKSTPY